MEHIIWSDDFSVGVDELNQQHMRLVGIINRLVDLDALKTPDQARIRSAYPIILSDMMEYAAIHFATEERYLKSIDYPEFANHRESHREFSRKASALKARAETGEFDISGTCQYLKTWLSEHILHADMDYRTFRETGT